MLMDSDDNHSPKDTSHDSKHDIILDPEYKVYPEDMEPHQYLSQKPIEVELFKKTTEPTY